MALFITSLNSGSNGNCYYVGNNTEAILIDVGISCRETEKRMKLLRLSLEKVKAIFISHEHGDHIKGVSVLANKYKIPVYITPATAQHGPILIKQLSKSFTADVPIAIGKLLVTPFTKMHDAKDPHSFIISENSVTVGVFTDIGIACKQVAHYFKQCHAVFLESNYDEELLEKGPYPLHLKNRIRGDQGHLSNAQALELFLTHRSRDLRHLILSHLSKENNSPVLAKELFTQHANGTTISVASRFEPTPVYTISNANIAENSNKQPPPISTQLGLFE